MAFSVTAGKQDLPASTRARLYGGEDFFDQRIPAAWRQEVASATICEDDLYNGLCDRGGLEAPEDRIALRQRLPQVWSAMRHPATLLRAVSLLPLLTKMKPHPLLAEEHRALSSQGAISMVEALLFHLRSAILTEDPDPDTVKAYISLGAENAYNLLREENAAQTLHASLLALARAPAPQTHAQDGTPPEHMGNFLALAQERLPLPFTWPASRGPVGLVPLVQMRLDGIFPICFPKTSFEAHFLTLRLATYGTHDIVHEEITLSAWTNALAAALFSAAADQKSRRPEDVSLPQHMDLLAPFYLARLTHLLEALKVIAIDMAQLDLQDVEDFYAAFFHLLHESPRTLFSQAPYEASSLKAWLDCVRKDVAGIAARLEAVAEKPLPPAHTLVMGDANSQRQWEDYIREIESPFYEARGDHLATIRFISSYRFSVTYEVTGEINTTPRRDSALSLLSELSQVSDKANQLSHTRFPVSFPFPQFEGTDRIAHNQVAMAYIEAVQVRLQGLLNAWCDKVGELIAVPRATGRSLDEDYTAFRSSQEAEITALFSPLKFSAPDPK